MLSGSLKEDASEDFTNIEEHLSNAKSALRSNFAASDETPIDVKGLRAAKGQMKASPISIFDLSMLQSQEN